jgi:FixJ family two-component response regulator
MNNAGLAHVCVVDDDESVREALPDLLSEFGFAASAFASADFRVRRPGRSCRLRDRQKLVACRSVLVP